MRKDPKIFLTDMLYSIDEINREVGRMHLNDFKNDIKTQDAVIRRLAVIGEAANNIPKDLKEKHPEIEWRTIVDMRNFLVHEYFEIDMGVIWETIGADLPKLKTEITKILKELG
ncbi:MAG: DUF86 domain-containing protein [Candidatus Marsarchaeota archaeon]|jgi:uncharacterized protein with HEPN domain|nr:DUF86 domain-containing protein [Candidatus Marsarchaeota archaeon]MCL5112076.1 DUF86 domain-containing protein [Candidatus Marsarchaeota archaeon]